MVFKFKSKKAYILDKDKWHSSILILSLLIAYNFSFNTKWLHPLKIQLLLHKSLKYEKKSPNILTCIKN